MKIGDFLDHSGKADCPYIALIRWLEVRRNRFSSLNAYAVLMR